MMKKYAMGIDIGGTNTAFGLVDEDGNVIAESKISTEKYRYFDDYKPYIDALLVLVLAHLTQISTAAASRPQQTSGSLRTLTTHVQTLSACSTLLRTSASISQAQR